MEDLLKRILYEIDKAKFESTNPNALTKRGGEYRIGLNKAATIMHIVIGEYKEENIIVNKKYLKSLTDFCSSYM